MSKLFREKSLQRISSPEQLNAYIRVSTPSVWLILAAVVVLLVGVCTWGVFGRLDTKLSVLAVSREGNVTAYFKAEDAAKLPENTKAYVGGAEGRVVSAAGEPVPVDESFTEYMRHVGSLQVGEFVLALALDAELPDGVYEAQIVVDSVSPMSFVLN